MEKVYEQRAFAEGNLVTQDGFLLTTEALLAEFTFITQAGDILVAQNGDILVGLAYDDNASDFIIYRATSREDRFISYIDPQKPHEITISQKTYSPTLTEKQYGQ